MGLFSRRGSAELITDLRPGEIFVFGSNAAGSHAGGAARQAVRDFGAIMGQARGLQCRSYALVSMSGLDVIAEETVTFCAFARTHPELTFLVTEIGCGIAGHTPAEVAPLFAGAPRNVVLPRSFRELLEGAHE